MPPAEPLTLFLTAIRTDCETQMRAGPNDQVAKEYAAAMQEGDIFPPIHVVFDPEKGDYILVDGYTRVAAATLAEFKRIDALVVGEGGIEEAQYLALQANHKNGVRRSSHDRENVILRAIAHPKCQDLSETDLAKFLGVTRREIFRVRAKTDQQKNPGRTRDDEYTTALDVIRAECPTLADNIVMDIVQVPRDEVVRLASKEPKEREALIPVMNERRLSLKQAEKVVKYRPADESLPVSTFLDFCERNPEESEFYFRNRTCLVSITVLND